MAVPYAEKLAEQRRRLAPRNDYPTFDLDRYRGSVVVVCAGRPGSEKTERWLRSLADLYRQGLPEGVRVVWLAVRAGPEQAAEAARRLGVPFAWFPDPAGAAASGLNHRLDPTLYVVGKWGVVRYAGELQPGPLGRMVVMLTKEQAEGDRQFFGSRGVDVGHLAPEFTLPDLEGRPVSLAQLRRSAALVCILFAGADLTSGPRATALLERSVRTAEPDQLAACVIYSLVNPQAVLRRYPRGPRRLHVLIDESGDVARTYRLENPPLWLLVGSRGVIRHRSTSAEETWAAICGLLFRPAYSPSAGPALLPP